MSSCYLFLLVGRIFFRCFGMLCFVCIVLPFLDIFLIFLLLPEFSRLFPSSCIDILSCLAFSFLSRHVPVFFLCFILLSAFVCFFFYLRFQSNFSSRFWFSVRVLLKEPRFSHKLTSLLYRFVYLIWWCFLLIYILILHSFFFSFPPWFFSNLFFFVMVKSSFFFHYSLRIF